MGEAEAEGEAGREEFGGDWGEAGDGDDSGADSMVSGYDEGTRASIGMDMGVDTDTGIGRDIEGMGMGFSVLRGEKLTTGAAGAI